MNLDIGGPGPGCSSMRVRRLLAGELTGVEKERTEAHVASCRRCAAVQEELAAEREALRRDVPFPQFAAAVAEKLAHRPHRSFAARWAPLAAAAGLALVAGTLLGWSLYGKLDEAAFRKVVLVLLLVSGVAIVVTGR